MESLAKSIIKHLGGRSNIAKIENCVTRLRVSVHSLEKTELDKIEQLSGVLHIFLGDTVQIVVGPGKSKKLIDIINRNHLIAKDKGLINFEEIELSESEIIETKVDENESFILKKKSKSLIIIAAVFVLLAMIKKILS